jgi:hypothetical protein
MPDPRDIDGAGPFHDSLCCNAAERALRVVALGRKNYLFAGSDRGGESAAAIYSLIGTAKLKVPHSTTYAISVTAGSLRLAESLFRPEPVGRQDSHALFDGYQLIGCDRFESFFQAVRPDNLDVRRCFDS